jgi:hypothetical protein
LLLVGLSPAILVSNFIRWHLQPRDTYKDISRKFDRFGHDTTLYIQHDRQSNIR